MTKWNKHAMLILIACTMLGAIEGNDLRAETAPSGEASAAASATSATPALTSPLAGSLGVTFVAGSSSTIVMEREGKKYLVDVSARTIIEVAPTSATATSAEGLKPGEAATPKSQETGTAQTAKTEKSKVYKAGDDYVFTLPTGRRLDRHGLYVNFNHRFTFEPAFSGPAKGSTLLGLDNFSLSSFGFRYGVTDKFSVSIYRSPSNISRPLELMGAYNFLDEHDGAPLNAAFRFSVDGQDTFQKNFSYNFEGIFSRSITHRAQLYVVPTITLDNRRLVVPGYPRPIPDLPGVNSFSLGFGGALDIRPTVALIAEVNPTLVNGRPLDIHRPPYAFGIQKKIWRHAFTFGFTTGPGTTVAMRSGTVAAYTKHPSADTPSGLFIGFDLTRQIF